VIARADRGLIRYRVRFWRPGDSGPSRAPWPFSPSVRVALRSSARHPHSGRFPCNGKARQSDACFMH